MGEYGVGARCPPPRSRRGRFAVDGIAHGLGLHPKAERNFLDAFDAMILKSSANSPGTGG